MPRKISDAINNSGLVVIGTVSVGRMIGLKRPASVLAS